MGTRIGIIPILAGIVVRSLVLDARRARTRHVQATRCRSAAHGLSHPVGHVRPC